MTTPADEIRTVIDRLAQATAAKNAAAVTASYGPAPVVFSLAPPLQAPEDSDGEGLQSWFDTWTGPIGYDLGPLSVAADGDVAFAHGLAHMTGTKVDGETPDLWFRATYGLRRIAGAWKVVHEHHSTPFYMDGSFKAAVDLKP